MSNEKPQKRFKSVIGNFLMLSILTFVILYASIGFVRWELDWPKHLSQISNINRLWFIIAIVLKLGIDVLLFLRISYAIDRPESNQKTYIYDDDNNEIDYTDK